MIVLVLLGNVPQTWHSLCLWPLLVLSQRGLFVESDTTVKSHRFCLCISRSRSQSVHFLPTIVDVISLYVRFYLDFIDVICYKKEAWSRIWPLLRVMYRSVMVIPHNLWIVCKNNGDLTVTFLNNVSPSIGSVGEQFKFVSLLSWLDSGPLPDVI